MVNPCTQGATGSSYFAYLIIAFFATGFCSTIGTYAWFADEDAARVGNSAEERLYADLPVAQFMAAVMFSYQLYNVCCAMLIADLNTLAFIGHHTATATLSYFVMSPPGFVRYYALYFLGVRLHPPTRHLAAPAHFAQLLRSLTHPALSALLRSPPLLAFAQVAELTQIPLTLVDACRAFKPLRTMIPTVNSVSRIAFALSFLALRLIAWPIVRQVVHCTGRTTSCSGGWWVHRVGFLKHV